MPHTPDAVVMGALSALREGPLLSSFKPEVGKTKTEEPAEVELAANEGRDRAFRLSRPVLKKPYYRVGCAGKFMVTVTLDSSRLDTTEHNPQATLRAIEAAVTMCTPASVPMPAYAETLTPVTVDGSTVWFDLVDTNVVLDALRCRDVSADEFTTEFIFPNLPLFKSLTDDERLWSDRFPKVSRAAIGDVRSYFGCGVRGTPDELRTSIANALETDFDNVLSAWKEVFRWNLERRMALRAGKPAILSSMCADNGPLTEASASSLFKSLHKASHWCAAEIEEVFMKSFCATSARHSPAFTSYDDYFKSSDYGSVLHCDDRLFVVIACCLQRVKTFFNHQLNTVMHRRDTSDDEPPSVVLVNLEPTGLALLGARSDPWNSDTIATDLGKPDSMLAGWFVPERGDVELELDGSEPTFDRDATTATFHDPFPPSPPDMFEW